MAETVQAAPITEPLDSYLRDVVQTLYAAVSRGLRYNTDDPTVTKQVIQDTEEILDVIMKGDVQEWVGAAS